MRHDEDRGPDFTGLNRRAAAQVISRIGGQDGPGETEAVLVVDSHVTMRIWDREIDEFAAELAAPGGFARVRRIALDGTDETDPARLYPSEPVVGDGTRRVLLVVTDALAAAWRSQAALPLLRTWGRAGPVAVVHLLPQHLWFRTGLDVSRVRVHSPRPWAANRELDWELREAPLTSPEPGPGPDVALAADVADAELAAGTGDDLESDADAVLVPVLALNGRWATAWTRLVLGREPDGIELSAVRARAWKRRPDAARALPWTEEVPDPQSTVPAVDRVSEFRAGASPTAFSLATRLAAAPLSLPVIASMVRTTAGADPVHVSELLMSGLVRPTGDAGDGPQDVVFTFAPDVREELLALGRRSDTARILRDVRVLLDARTGDEDEPLLPPPSEPLDSLVMPQHVGRRCIDFLRIELAALRALSGRYAQRAARLSSLLGWHDRRYAVSLEKTSAISAGREPPRHDAFPPDLANEVALQSVAGPVVQSGNAAAHDPAGSTETTSPEGAAPMSTTPQRTVEGDRTSQPRVWGNLPPRNPNFTGRMELLAHLDERLREGTTTVLPEAIHGMGGVGKTQLAIEYAYRHQSQYDVVWWIPSERPGQIGQALVELAGRLGLETSTEANVAGPAVREALREGRPYSRWLLIFDNADNPEQVRPYFPTGGDGTILVTSRNRRWSLIGGSLEVDVFSREESVQLLRRTGPPLADEEADQLAVALGDLPLALEQAAAWRAETGMPASEYLRLFESKRTELLETAPPPDYQLPVAAAWNVSLDHLETRSPQALRLLQLCSYFAPDPISRSIFSGLGNSSIFPELDATLNDPMRLARAIREVNRYSLARIDHRTNSIEMHRLVQLVLNNRMTPAEQDRMRKGAHTLLAAADPKSPNAPSNWPRYAELYGHAIASEAVKSDQPWVRQLVMNIAEYLYYWGDHEVSLDFSEVAWNTWRSVFGEEDQQTLLMGLWLGFLYWAVGRYREANALTDELLSIYARTAPESGEDTREDALRAINLKGAMLRIEGDFAAGAELDRTVYERARQAFGEDDPTTFNAAHNLGVSLRVAGDYWRALELDQRTLELKTRILGRDHRETLLSQNSVVISVRETGDYVGALDRQEAIVEAYRTTFGRGNPTTTSALRQLSVAARKAGDHARSLELATDVSRRFIRRYGETHPQSLSAALTLSIALRENGDLEAARDRGRRACEGYRQIFSPQHPHVLAADVDLAVTLRLLGQAHEARRLDEAAVQSMGERLGRSHPSVLACAINLASDLAAIGDLSDARAHGEETLGLCQETLGEIHPTTLTCAINLSADLIALGEVDEGTALREATLERMERALDDPRVQAGLDAHPVTVQTRSGERANCNLDPVSL